MSVFPTSRVQRPAQPVVYVRRADGAAPPTDGSADGYVWDGNLRAERVEWKRGPDPGHAALTYVPLDGATPSVESVLSRYSVDDQVRIVLSTEGGESLIFEGVLARHTFGIVREGGREGGDDSERIGFIAIPLPALEDRLTTHMIDGRWFREPPAEEGGDPTVFFALAPDLPATFNFRGRPNMAPAGEAGADLFQAAGVTMPFRAWTHDDDPAGEYWTGREAVKALLGMWLYGFGGVALDRMAAVEAETLAGLVTPVADGESPAARFAGLDDRLPEVDVRGLGVYSAVAAVCDAIGFQFSILPAPLSAGADRAYVLRLWRRGSGPLVDLLLPARGDFSGSAAADLRRANVSKIQGMRDAVGTVNEVIGCGDASIEATLVLKPLWGPSEIDDAEITAALQTEDADGDYRAKHVVNGSQFEEFGHVGRAWGIDCTGAWTRAGLGYDAASAPGYAHNDAATAAADFRGADWLAMLGIDGSDAITAEREDLGIPSPAVHWTRRLRHPLPLTRFDAQRRGVDYILEVTEDITAATPSWTRVDLELSTLKEQFGILITSIPNLASVSLDSIASGGLPAIEDSWWQLIADKKLGLRLTCRVPADHAALFVAQRQGTSGTLYRKVRMVHLDIEETWSAPGSFYNSAGTDFLKISGWGVVDFDGQYITSVRDRTDRLRDAWEGLRLPVSAATWLMQPDHWRVGDRVWGLRGRDFSFGTTAGNATRHPAIVGVTFHVGSGGQGITLQLHDDAMLEGGPR